MAQVPDEQRRIIRLFAETCGVQLSVVVGAARERGYSDEEIAREIDIFMSRWRQDWAWLFTEAALDMIVADTMDAYRNLDKPRGRAN